MLLLLLQLRVSALARASLRGARISATTLQPSSPLIVLFYVWVVSICLPRLLWFWSRANTLSLPKLPLVLLLLQSVELGARTRVNTLRLCMDARPRACGHSIGL